MANMKTFHPMGKDFKMINKIELKLFMKELQRLEEDYQKNESEFLKEEIMNDIELLKNVINAAKVNND